MRCVYIWYSYTHDGIHRRFHHDVVFTTKNICSNKLIFTIAVITITYTMVTKNYWSTFIFLKYMIQSVKHLVPATIKIPVTLRGTTYTQQLRDSRAMNMTKQ